MNEDKDKIKDLLVRLENISEKQTLFQQEIDEIHEEIKQLRSNIAAKNYFEKAGKLLTEPTKQIESTPSVDVVSEKESVVSETEKEVRSTEQKIKPPSGIKSNLEEFIGGNLINKIGIIIIILGVGIGVKYAIDHDLISPLVRIILGYLVGFGLLGFAIRLRKKYDNFSAVLVSGSMAIFYFISYAFHAYYKLIPQWLAFVLMVIITVITVLAAIRYDRQVIAHIGLVGAYTIPFIFKETNTRPDLFFSYMAIINGGILLLSLLKQWKPIFYSSFLITWVIFTSWFILNYNSDKHFSLTAAILPIFFLTFHVIFLANKLTQKDKLNSDEILIFLINSFILFGFGLYILHDHETGKDLLGTFTLINAAIHTGSFAFLFNRRYPDRILLHLILGLTILFITVAIPIELKGNWITIAWLGESIILFSFGRLKKWIFVERLSYGVFLLTTSNLILGWIKTITSYGNVADSAIKPFLNFNFLTACLVILIFGIVFWLHKNQRYRMHIDKEDVLYKLFNILLPVILISVVYLAFRVEAGAYFNRWNIQTRMDLSTYQDIPSKYWYEDYNISCFKSLGLMIYTMLFVTILSFINILKFNDNNFGIVNLMINGLVLLVSIPTGYHLLGILRDSYLNQSLSEFYSRGSFHIIIRYIYIAIIGLLLFASYKYVRQKFLRIDFSIPMDILLHLSLLAIISTELIQWLDFSRSADSHKFELSILFGLYAVLLIILGIRGKKKHLRICAIVLFSCTLLKLFIYDIAHLDTISKTIVFIVLGILLLITSFLYIKYRKILFGNSEEKH
jgi:uncharacterized membrane protein